MNFLNTLYRKTKRKLFKYSKERIDHQFSQGKWDWLVSLDEMPRYSLLAGGHRYHNPGGSILDAGCGQGILLERFKEDDYSFYLCIDFSEAAIQKITPRSKVNCVQADISEYVPTQKFDSIIFNESLYYVKNPLKQLARYLTFLNPDGFIFISIHLRKNAELVEQIKEQFVVVDSNIVSNKNGETWSYLTIKKVL